MRIIDQRTLASLTSAAAISPRLRKNLNLHLSDDFVCHRFFNAIEPGSYIRPHRHLDPAKDETIVIIKGKLGVIQFSFDGSIVESVVLSATGQASVVDLPHGAYHCAVSLEPGTVFFEAKAGPYLPLSTDETASWAPAEGTPEAVAYVAQLAAAFVE